MIRALSAVFHEEAEDNWYVGKDPQQVLQLHCGEHTDQLNQHIQLDILKIPLSSLQVYMCVFLCWVIYIDTQRGV